MIPVARSENLFIQEVGNDLIIYDQETNVSHCLTPLAATVWRHCNGKNTVKDIAQLLEQDLNRFTDRGTDAKELVYLSLEELEKCSLIKQYVQQSVEGPAISRREMVKTATLVGGFAVGSMFPLVRSIIAPEPAMAASGNNGRGRNPDPGTPRGPGTPPPGGPKSGV